MPPYGDRDAHESIAEDSLVHQTGAAWADNVKFFFEAFQDKHGRYKYFDSINNMMAENRAHLTVDYADFQDFERSDAMEQVRRKIGEKYRRADGTQLVLTDMSDVFLTEPHSFLEAARTAALGVLREINPAYEMEIHDYLSVRPAGLQELSTTPLRKIGPRNAGKLVCINNARVDAVSGIDNKGALTAATYRCGNCLHEIEKAKGQPKTCKECGEDGTMELDLDKSVATELQYFRLLEESAPTAGPVKNVQRMVWVDCRGELTDVVSPGDTIRVHAIVRAVAIKGKKIERLPLQNVAYGQVLTYYLEAVNIEKLSKSSRVSVVTDHDRRRLEKWMEAHGSAMDPHRILSHFAHSLAPEHHGDEWLKMMLLLVATSGAKYVKGKRAWINLLMVGDPSTGKTTLLKALFAVTDAIYMAGEGIEETGIGAAIVREEGIGMVAKSGFGPLGDGMGHELDEADKMGQGKKTEARRFWDEMNTIMEDGRYLNMRGGIRVDMRATGWWVVACNPVYGTYDPYKNFAENVPFIPDYTLTRFDVIAVLRGSRDRTENDAKIDVQVDHWTTDRSAKSAAVASNPSSSTPTSSLPADMLSVEDLAIVAKVAQDTFVESWDPAAVTEIKKVAKSISSIVNASESVNYVQRHTDALMRMCEAVVKLCWRTRVTKEDVIFVEKQLLFEMYKRLGIDILANKIDMGVVYGKDRETVSKQKLFMEIFSALAAEAPDEVVEEKKLIEEMIKSQKWFDDQDCRKEIERFSREARIYEKMSGRWHKS